MVQFRSIHASFGKENPDMTSLAEKSLRVALAVVLMLGILTVPAYAASPSDGGAAVEVPAETNYWKPLIAIGAGLVTIGGGLGIGKLAAAAMEGTARQPEAGGDIRTSMIIAAALIEGFTFFALIVCMTL